MHVTTALRIFIGLGTVVCLQGSMSNVCTAADKSEAKSNASDSKATETKLREITRWDGKRFIEMPLPKGWITAGSDPSDYDMGVDDKVGHTSTRSGCIRSIKEKTSGFGTLMQGCKADAYRGKRVRMTSWLKTSEVKGWAGIWLRVDGFDEDSKDSLAFDNMQDRSLAGSTDWKEVSIVLDVSEKAKNLAYGVLLSGSGTVWMDGCKLEIVGKDVPTTGNNGSGGYILDKPTNLDFKDR